MRRTADSAPHDNADELIDAAVVEAIGDTIASKHRDQFFDAGAREEISRTISDALRRALRLREGATSIKVNKDGRIVVKVISGPGSLMQAVWSTQMQCEDEGWDSMGQDSHALEDCE